MAAKQSPLMVADAFREARRVGREFELGPVDGDELGEVVQGEHAVDHEDLVAGDGERRGDQRAQILRHRRLELEPDHRAAAAAFQRALEEAHEVLGLFLDLDVRVADDAERPLPLDHVAGEEPGDEQRDRLVEADEAVDARVAGKPDEAVEGHRHAHQRGHPLPRRFAAQARARRSGRDWE